MKLSSISSLSTLFTIVIIVLLYIIIFFIVKIMYKDANNLTKNKNNLSKFGIEVIKIQNNKSNFKVGGIIPINAVISIGRGKNNFIRIYDNYVSNYHAKIYVRNGKCIIKDLKSTNGTFVNNRRIKNKMYLKPDDMIKIGKNIFKVIG